MLKNPPSALVENPNIHGQQALYILASKISLIPYHCPLRCCLPRDSHTKHHVKNSL